MKKNPPAFKDNEETNRWLKGLGPTVQRCADVLEKELDGYSAYLKKVKYRILPFIW